LVAKLKSQLIENWPIKNIYSLKSHYVEKITNAKRSIKIITPYFTPPRWLISLLDDATRRGVEVEILVPEKVDWKIFTSLNYRYIHKLHPMGIKFYLAKNMNHGKLLLIDNEEGLIGSQNIDPLSFELNYEVGIFFKEKKLLEELNVIFEKWKSNSFVFEPRNYKMRPIDYFVFAIAKILRPIL
jgi:cardiolipin synthase